MLQCTITETKDIEPVVYEWGAVKWVANRDLNPDCEQSSDSSTSCPERSIPSTGTARVQRLELRGPRSKGHLNSMLDSRAVASRPATEPWPETC